VSAEPPAPIAHYNLLERIGAGTLGPVYRARDTKVGRTVALKLVPDDRFVDQAARTLFLDDARAAMVLSHPNTATLFDAAEYDGGCYLAYEFASGLTLRRESAGRAVNPRRAVELAVQIADALADAHAHGVLHADLRPETIIVTQKGSAKVLDFGMSRWTRGGQIRLRAATASEALGAEAIAVVSYMSPEQAAGAPLDHRTDVFSLGVILYEMLAGRNPFAATSTAETLANVAGAQGPGYEAAGASPDLAAIVTRAMAKDVEKRHQSAASFSAELRSVGAMFDVRSGHLAPDDLLPIDDEPGTGRWWAVGLIGAAALAVAVWWLAG
jgi:serine/threonine protein kinase